ncbi:GNAT family N-acetyltransferase [Acinetobacter ihumii]|uniref:GNAT family N-acetyltransferase n=1 Tax=Acinetobacter ihumii TaxID=2483802 RepID=UPI00102FD34B|nr:GNAT family N-acetyltransferase [Acinetobacter ihumii]
MNIQQKDDGKHGAFELHDSETLAGEMVYTWAGEKMLIIDHTDVADAYRGQGVGRKLLDAVVDFARKNQIKVIPLCPYAKSVFDKDPSIRDVLRDA